MEENILEQPCVTNGQGKELLQANSVDDNRSGFDNKIGSKLGKFKDVESLLTAYNNLQSDYTKKCQSLACLQKRLDDNEENSSPQEVKEGTSWQDKEQEIVDFILSNAQLRDKVVSKYIFETKLDSVPTLIGSQRGSNVVVSPVSKPKNLEDAEKIVRDMFTNNK